MFSKVKKLSQNNSEAMQNKRTHSEVTESTPMTSNTSKRQKTDSKSGDGPKKLYMLNEFDTTDIAVVVAKNNQDELVPKMVQQGKEDSKYPLQVNTPVISIQYSDMKKGGDEGKFGKTSKEASYNLKVRKGLSERVAQALPNEEARQEALFNFVEDTQRKMMQTAWNTQGCMENHKKKAKKSAKKNKTDEFDEFYKGATLSVFKDYTDEEGEDKPMMVVTRRASYLNEQGEEQDNRPVVWKMTPNGDYEVIPYNDLKYIPQGSCVKFQLGSKGWCNSSGYGISWKLGKNVILVTKAKSNKSGNSGSGAPVLPYISFE
jgi:hypothetical protein